MVKLLQQHIRTGNFKFRKVTRFLSSPIILGSAIVFAFVFTARNASSLYASIHATEIDPRETSEKNEFKRVVNAHTQNGLPLPSETELETTQNDGSASHQKRTSDQNDFLIIQTSYADTGSTLLANILVGLYDPIDSNYTFLSKRKYGGPSSDPEWRTTRQQRHHKISTTKTLADARIVKTHSTDLKLLVSLFEPAYGERIYFVRSDRCRRDPQCGEKNMLCVDYDDLLYGTAEERKRSVVRVASALIARFPSLVYGNVERADARLAEMDSSAKELSNPDEVSLGFFMENVDHKFGIHPNHRGQSKTWRLLKGDTFCGTRRKRGEGAVLN